MTKIIELIYTEERRGTGKDDDPVRMCKQLWTKDGLLVLDYDPCGKVSAFNNKDFLEHGEIWETQVWLMWILALGLKETGHNVLFWIVLVWSIISFIGAVVKAGKAKHLEVLEKNTTI